VKRFNDYLRFRENSLSDQGKPSIGLTAATQASEGHLGGLYQIITLAWSKYRQETKQFFQQLATDKKDHELSDIISRLEQEGEGAGHVQPRKHPFGGPEDVVKPHTADSQGIGGET